MFSKVKEILEKEALNQQLEKDIQKLIEERKALQQELENLQQQSQERSSILDTVADIEKAFDLIARRTRVSEMRRQIRKV